VGDRPDLTIGEWEVNRVDGRISRSGESLRLRPKTMEVLLCLASRPDELVERDEIIARVWGRELVTDEPLTTCIAELRRSLGDKASHPRYIQTVPKRGYRLVAEVGDGSAVASPGSAAPLATATVAAEPSHSAQASSSAAVSPASPRRTTRWLVVVAALGAAFMLGEVSWFFLGDRQGVEEAAEEGVVEPLSAEPPVIAVLPFLNMSPDPNNAFFCDGIAEEILNSLTQIDGLRVRSRTSSFALKARNLDVAEIAERLQVTHILEGSIRRSGEQLRISAQLINVNADTPVWSEVFDKSLENVFEVQGDIATRVSAALEIALDLEQQQKLGRVGTVNTEAYELYLRGRQLLARRTTAGITKAAENFTRAVALDPGYAQAYLGLADAYLLLPQYNDLPGAHYLEQALEAINRALEIDPDFGEAYATLGSVREELGQFEAAEQAFKVALERAPRYATTYHWYGFMLYRTGRQEEADRMLRLAIEQDPLSNLLSYGLSANLLAMGRFDEAEARYNQIIDRDPEFSWAYEGLGELYWNGRGRLDLAAEAYQRAIRYDPDSAYFQALLGAIYLDAGDAASAAQWIEGARRIQAASPVVRVHEALLREYRGEHELAYEIASGLLAEDPGNYLALAISRNTELAQAQAEAAKSHYARAYPGLLESGAEPDPGNFQAAVDLAFVLRELGEEEQAAALLERAWPIAESYPRHGLPYRLSDVKILTMQGRHEEALDVLEAAIDSGWRPYWWFFLERDPALAPLRESARYPKLVQKFAVAA
jgi:TolB-like protein/DNA-binding winged helix-turn-helix (wHTH) protein/Tfp pilus assembly protein PilF